MNAISNLLLNHSGTFARVTVETQRGRPEAVSSAIQHSGAGEGYASWDASRL